MKNSIFFILAALALSGCVSTSDRIKYVFVKPPETTYSTLVVPKPMNLKMYLEASALEREDMCLNTIDAFQHSIYQHHISRKALASWVDEQLIIYPAK